MKSTELRQLIRESINEYIREIDEAGNVAALEAKMNKTQEAIELREKKMNMDGLDEAYHDMLDKGKMKELGSEVKALKKSLAKYEKQLEKLKNKADKSPKVEKEEEKEIVDETENSDERPVDTDDMEGNADGDYAKAFDAMEESETNEMDIYEMLHMQKLAGIISETEYKAKVEEAKKMTAAQKEKKEDIVKGMKKSKSFGKSKDEKAKMYATATKLATKEKVKSLKEEIEALFENTSPEDAVQQALSLAPKLEKSSELDALAQKIAKDPNLVAQMEKALQKGGIALNEDKNNLDTQDMSTIALNFAKKGEQMLQEEEVTWDDAAAGAYMGSFLGGGALTGFFYQALLNALPFTKFLIGGPAVVGAIAGVALVALARKVYTMTKNK